MRKHVHRLLLTSTCIGCLSLICARAQFAECKLTSIADSDPWQYPPIAQAAHVYGDVILLATFGPDGVAQAVSVQRGPEMLRPSATDYVASWHTNSTTEGQTCSIVLSYTMNGSVSCDRSSSSVTMQSPRHLTIKIAPTETCDPSASIVRIRHHFLFLHWTTHSRPHVYA